MVASRTTVKRKGHKGRRRVCKRRAEAKRILGSDPAVRLSIVAATAFASKGCTVNYIDISPACLSGMASQDVRPLQSH